MNGILTWIDCNFLLQKPANYSERSLLSITFQFVKYSALNSLILIFFSLLSTQNERAFTSKFFIICSC